MVHCPIFLKKKQGISITELLIVVAFLAVMTVLLLVYLNPMAQMGKARDARRKSDLSKLKNVLEDYYNDKKCYPSSLNQLVPDYIGQLPTDPLPSQSYAYYPDGCDKYRIYTNLDYKKDSAIVEAGCQSGCGPQCAYNFGIWTTNTSLESCPAVAGPTPTPCVLRYACQQGYCQDVDPALCPPAYCTSNCDKQCANDPGAIGEKIGCL